MSSNEAISINRCLFSSLLYVNSGMDTSPVIKYDTMSKANTNVFMIMPAVKEIRLQVVVIAERVSSGLLSAYPKYNSGGVNLNTNPETARFCNSLSRQKTRCIDTS